MTVSIPLTKGAICIVDDVDADLSKLKWHLHSEGYAVRKPHSGIIRMHRVILARILGREVAPGEDTDHRNRNRLDNRRENLRVADRSLSLVNQKLSSRNTSGYRGVSMFKPANLWQAQIHYRGVHRHLGYFKTPEAAALAYNTAARLLHGDDANLNIVASDSN